MRRRRATIITIMLGRDDMGHSNDSMHRCIRARRRGADARWFHGLNSQSRPNLALFEAVLSVRRVALSVAG